ncbi:AP-1 complex subunit mu-1 [Rhynchocyon petersi]
MSASAVYVLDLKGKVLICRNYRGDVDMSEVEHFMPILMEKEEEGMLSPILAHGGVRFMWIKHNNLYLVATSKKNACVSLVFSFLYKVVQVFSEYFKELEEESIRDNFVIIYELLDELMDFGYPQTTDSKILQEYITQEGHKLETGAPRPPATVTNAVSWRSEGIKYRKNEVFLDVIESVNLLVSANGNVLRSEIVGSIKMRVFLSGMPELRLGLNDKVLFDNTGRGKSKSVELEDVKFHQCVRLSRFENDRTISFIPPDGEFELMSYRLNTHVKPLIWIESVIEKHSHSRIEYMIKAKSQFKRRSTANNVEIHIPVPNDADSPKFKTTVGSVKWVPENSEIVWSIKSFPGGKEYLMRAHFGLPSVEAEDKEGKPPISVKFEIPYFTTSGIQVRYLKIIEKSGYQALPWVRYITQNGGEYGSPGGAGRAPVRQTISSGPSEGAPTPGAPAKQPDRGASSWTQCPPSAQNLCRLLSQQHSGGREDAVSQHHVPCQTPPAAAHQEFRLVPPGAWGQSYTLPSPHGFSLLWWKCGNRHQAPYSPTGPCRACWGFRAFATCLPAKPLPAWLRQPPVCLPGTWLPRSQPSPTPSQVAPDS